MYQIRHYLNGFFKNFFNPRISVLSFVSSNVVLDKTTCIYRGVKAKYASIGAYTYIGNNTDVENAQIGKYCSIADHCRIGMSGHSLNYLSTSPIFTQASNALQKKWIDKDVFDDTESKETLFIGNDVWVGSHVLINGGVHVGNGACIGAGAVVVKDIPPYAIVGGVPAKIIRYRFSEDIIEKLEEIEWWELSEKKLKENLCLFQSSNIDVNNLKNMNS